MTYDDWKADISNEHGSAPNGPEEDPEPVKRPRMLIGTTHWWQDSGEIGRLLRHFRDGDGLDVADCIEIVEKPWHWDAEYQEMCREQTTPGMSKPDWPEDVIR